MGRINYLGRAKGLSLKAVTDLLLASDYLPVATVKTSRCGVRQNYVAPKAVSVALSDYGV